MHWFFFWSRDKVEEAYEDMLGDEVMFDTRFEDGDDEMLDAMYMYADEFYDRGVEMEG